jgi:hypothetical protein
MESKRLFMVRTIEMTAKKMTTIVSFLLLAWVVVTITPEGQTTPSCITLPLHAVTHNHASVLGEMVLLLEKRDILGNPERTKHVIQMFSLQLQSDC